MAAAVDLRRRVVAEAVGTALLLATVIGNVAIALLANTIAAGAGLAALFRWLTPSLPAVAKAVVVPHGEKAVDS